MNLTLGLFLIIIAITLGITYWASQRVRTTTDFYAAGRTITGWQNGIAVAGDYMSAASFLGIAGLIALNGYDGFLYSVGFLVAYLTVLLIVAEPFRNSGRYTMADVLAYRLNRVPVRSAAALSTLIVSLFYMLAQMIGAGTLVHLLVPRLSANLSIVVVGVLMVCYVVFGGMIATTWVQIVKAILLMTGTFIISILVLSKYSFNLGHFFDAIAGVKDQKSGLNFTQPGILYNGKYGSLDLISLSLALILGTAGLPHILMRFYTVRSAKVARSSVGWAIGIIGSFYLLTTFLGFGAATLLGPDLIKKTPGGSNLAAPLLAQKVGGGADTFGGEFFLALISAIAFATILAVVAGLTIAASSAFAHDFWANVVRHGKERPGEEVMVARVAALVVGALAIVLGIGLKNLNVAFLVGLAFAVAASANLPVIVLALFWKKFNTWGAVAGILTGLIAALVLIAISPAIMGIDPPGTASTSKHLIQHAAIFKLSNPGIISIPLGFVGAFVGALAKNATGGREMTADALFPEMLVRANTGAGAE
ncbi:MAG: solute symporter family protein [Thermomicrobiales bacterium]